jgi:cytochrome P450
LDTSTEFLFGTTADSLHNPNSHFAAAFSVVQEVQTARVKIGPFWRLYWPLRFIKAVWTLDSFVQPFVERSVSMAQKNARPDDGEEEDGSSLTEALSRFTTDPKMIRDQVVSTLLAGRDTTACAMSWLTYELARHPECYAKLREEVLDTLGVDELPTYEQLKNMKYLQHCITEMLRLYPIVPFNIRYALKDTTLPKGGGSDGSKPIAVLKGDPIGYMTLCMQRRKDLFGDTVDDFNPDRWIDWIPDPWTYIPFNGGPRICLGQNFALTEMAYATARMAQRYRSIEDRSNGAKVKYRTDIVLRPEGCTYIALSRALGS